MQATGYFRAQAFNNAWANHRLLAAVGELRPEELSAPRTGFFPSIAETLNHILLVDRFYVSGLEGYGVAIAELEEPPFPYSIFADLQCEQAQVDRRLIAVCEQLDDATLAETIELPRDGWTQTERKDRTLLHLFQHQVHHRGQVHSMLSGTAVTPPQLDEFFLGHERERALRADDFAALGFEEQAIWR
ncbi:MAG TPA: DinB family protein [Woeseiaceae bacterium]